jgi:bifunctional ADP-heptose synthase (sugar kinase/adenylyltransferase)
VLWRQRMKLEFEMQGLFIRTTTLVQEWQRLHGSKEAVGNEVSTLASHILLAGFVGLQQERTACRHSYEQNGIVQQEHRIQQDMVRCSMDIATLQAQIIRLDFELASL